MSLKLMFQPPKGKLQVFRHGRLQALFLKKGRHKFTV